jgi:hypothetical protein
MAWPGDIQSLHNPATNTSPPASWGDAVRDALQFLGSVAAAEVLTSETSSTASYGDLTTAGPAVTVTTGTKALVVVSARIAHSSINGYGLMSHAVSGATTIAASDSWYAAFISGTANQAATVVGVAYHTTLTAGSNTFTAKYFASAATASFQYRKIFVIPLT